MHRTITTILAVFLLALLLALLLACGSGSPSSMTTTAAPAVAAPTGAPAPAAAAPTAAPAEPTAAPASTVGKVGDRVESGGTALTVTKAERAKENGVLKPQAGNVFLLLDVLIENTGDAKTDYNPFYFKAKDGDGFEYTATISTDSAALKNGFLEKGDKVRGSVALEVKEAAKGLVVSYQSLGTTLNGDPIKVAIED